MTALVPTRPPPIEPPASRFLFPDARRGVGPHGVVCVGGDFAPGTLLSAYRRGIFPWPVSGELVPWCSPDPRAILPLDEPPHWSRSLRRTLRRSLFRVTVDVAFAEVMDGCGDREEGTWILPALAEGYRELHRLGWAHSVEVWNASTGELVGGIYGLAIGAMFAGESMFHRETDASKVAFATLAERLFAAGYRFLDAQQMTPHLASLGCVDVPRAELLRKLRSAIAEDRSFPAGVARLRMCGIAGVLRRGGAPPDLGELARMAGALFHRGPDEHGIYLDDHAGLAHARLSIVDVASGQQPMTSEDGTLALVFNGEIFNFVELGAELMALGHRFHTKSDTEVVLHAISEWGEGAFARFNGQFAIALWDSKNRTLTLARDRYGVRPLHVAEHEGRLVFASEVKAIFAACPGMPRELDPVGLSETFTFWTVVPPQTAFRGISELRPGHLRVISPDGDREIDFTPLRYPTSAEDGFRGSIEDATEALESALERATSLRMLRADVPVGSYLSGGLDSSVVAALGLRAKGARFRTFSLRFADAEYDETGFQREMATRLGTEHFEVEVSRHDVAEVFPEVVWHTERPLLRTAPAPLLLLSRLVRREGIKVVLTGEGADEMLAGYDLFREGKVRRFWAKQPASTCRPQLIDRLYPWLQRSPTSQRAMARQFFGRDLARAGDAEFAHLPRWQSAMALQRLFGERVKAEASAVSPVKHLLATLPPDFPRWTALARDQYLEIRTLLSGYLLSSQGDRVMMANSIEGRFPFLDREVVALCDSLPASYKLRVLDEKHVLKRAAKKLVPPSILARKKQPYRAPDAVSFVGDDAPDWVGSLTTEDYARDAGYFEPRAVAQLWEKLRARKADPPPSNADNMAVVGVLSTHLLHEKFVRAFSPGAPITRPRTLIDRRKCP